MILTPSEKAAVLSLWNKAAPQAAALGAEALTRVCLSFPQFKVHFPNLDLTPGSADLLKLGAMIMNALGRAANHLDNLAGNLPALSDLRAFILRVSPEQFVLLSHTIQVTLAVHYPRDFTAKVQAAWDKFVREVAALLTK